jgi:hypothetical protein
MPKKGLTFFGGALVGLVTALVGSPAHAGTTTFVTPTGSTIGSRPVDAEATFTTGFHSLTITLTNLEANPSDVSQNLSDLSFTISGGSLTGASLISSSGQEITVHSNGTYTTGSTGLAGWSPTLSGTSGLLDDLSGPGHAGPAHTIIGPPDAGNTYSNANNSITGNGAHNPFLNQTVTFTISGSNITSDTTVTAATFSFGTTSGSDVIGHMPVPEPSSLVLGLMGAGLVGAVRYRRTRRRA